MQANMQLKHLLVFPEYCDSEYGAEGMSGTRPSSSNTARVVMAVFEDTLRTTAENVYRTRRKKLHKLVKEDTRTGIFR